MKILFTSVGRRVELIQAFRQAAERLGISLLIYGADLSTSAPALFFCHRHVQPCPIHQPDYIPRLVDICSHEHIDALIPTIDTDLLLLSQSKERFEQIGTRVIISNEEKIHICRDKRLTSAFFEACGLLTPHPVDAFDDYEGGFPCFIKPLNGSSSINAFKVDTPEELRAYAHTIFDYIIQPYIEGTEYTVDIFCDLDGNPIYITPRERLAVRSGEVLKTRVAQDERIIAECRRLVAEFRPCGPITVQLIRQRTTGDDYYIEINPRFGGGAPLSMKAGADSAEVMLRLLSGQKIAYQPNAATDGALYSRYDQSVCTSAGQQQGIKAVVFDLDDTLYSEIEYVFSGFKALTGLLQDIPDAYDKLLTAFEDGKPAIDTVLKNAGRYTDDRKQSCMQAYRLHSPDIAAYPGVHEMLRALRADEIKLGIITDGRPEGQRKKLAALGLEALVNEIIITDELGGESFRKPCDIAFRVMQRKLGVPFQQMLYVGDNLQKDFIAPTALGMQSLYFRNPDGLYRCENERATNERIVTWTVNSKEEFVRIIHKIGGGGG